MYFLQPQTILVLTKAGSFCMKSAWKVSFSRIEVNLVSRFVYLIGECVISILLMEEILHQLIGSLPNYWQCFIIHPRWCRISCINSMYVLMVGLFFLYNCWQFQVGNVISYPMTSCWGLDEFQHNLQSNSNQWSQPPTWRIGDLFWFRLPPFFCAKKTGEDRNLTLV